MRTEREQQINQEIVDVLTLLHQGVERLGQLLIEQSQIHTTKLDHKDDEIEAAARRWWHRPLGLTKETTGWRWGKVREI